MTTKKNDFVEIEFTGKISNTDEIFDTNIKADAEKAGLNIKDIKPFILSIGHKMLPKGFDENLEGKDTNKDYTIEIKPEDAFGKRNPQMVRMVPTKLFHEQKIDPQRGMQLNLDGQLVKVLSSDRGRTLVDFNNPLAGKNVTYNYKINKIITDEKEKTITFKITKELEPFVKMFAPKFEEILGLKVESKVIEPKEETTEKKKE